MVFDILPSLGMIGVAGEALGGVDHGVVAALGLQRHAVARRRRQLARPGAGGDDRPIAGDGVAVQRHRPQPTAGDVEAGGAAGDQARALGLRVLHQGRNIGAGIRAMAAGSDQHAEPVAPIERRLELAQLVGVQLGPFDAVVAAQVPGQLFGGEIGAFGKM